MKPVKLAVASFLVLSLFWAQTAAAKQYNIDPEHSHVGFAIRHLLSHVRGQFNKFSGTFDFDEANKTGGNLKVVIDVASIDTNNEKRDKHLRSADFFDVAKFPKIKFTSTKVAAAGDKKYKVQGYLTLHGVTKLVTLDVAYLGTLKDPWGNVKSAFSATTKINRKDFGIEWNETLETGGLLLGNDVTIHLEVEAAPVVETKEVK